MELDVSSITNFMPAAVSTLAIGALTCFMGYRLRNIWVAVSGFVFGFLLARSAAVRFVDAGSAAAIGLAAGLAVMVLCIWLFQVGIFILCGSGAVLFALPYLPVLGLPDFLFLLVLLVIFVAAGLLSRRFMKSGLILITSFSGAGSIVSSLASLGIPYISAGGSWGLICTLVFAIAGIVVQFSGAKGL